MNFRILQNFDQGRRLTNRDIESIQSQLDLLYMMLPVKGPFVIQGCEVTKQTNTVTVAPGFICLNGKVIEITSPVTGISGTALVSDLDEQLYALPYGQPVTKFTQKRTRAKVVVTSNTTTSFGDMLYILEEGMRTMAEAVQEATTALGDIKLVDDVSNFDSSGIGFGPQRGWRIPSTTFMSQALDKELMIGNPPSIPVGTGLQRGRFYVTSSAGNIQQSGYSVMLAKFVGTGPNADNPNPLYRVQ